jgi:hypothetical protein
MADGIKITVEGDKELVAFLNAAHDEAVLIAAQEAAMAGAVRARTLLRRAAPRGANSRTRIKAGWPRLSDVLRAKGGDRAPIAFAGIIGRGPYYLKVLDQGRKPYKKRNGASYAGSPPMHPWWDAAVASLGPQVTDVMSKKLTAELRNRIPSLISKMRAPLHFK